MRWLSAWCVLLASAVLSVAGEVNGIAAVVTGSTTENYAPVFEYTSIRFPADRFEMILPNGKPEAGLRIHIPEKPVLSNIDFRRKDHKQLLADMQAMSDAYVHAKPLLKERIERLRKVVEAEELDSKEAASELKPLATEGGVRLTMNGESYEEAWPSSFKNGRLGFTHKAGVFSVDAGGFRFAFLKQLGERFKELGGKAEYQSYLATFVSSAMIGDQYHTGVRMIGVGEDGRITLTTDKGLVTCTDAELKKDLSDALFKAWVARNAIEARFQKHAAQEAADQESYYQGLADAQQKADKKLQDLSDQEVARNEEKASDARFDDFVRGVKVAATVAGVCLFARELANGFFSSGGSGQDGAPYPYSLSPEEFAFQKHLSEDFEKNERERKQAIEDSFRENQEFKRRQEQE